MYVFVRHTWSCVDDFLGFLLGARTFLLGDPMERKINPWDFECGVGTYFCFCLMYDYYHST